MRRFSSNRRIVRGPIVEKMIKIAHTKSAHTKSAIFDRQVEEWFHTSDITSLTLEEENKKHVSKGECDIPTEQTHNSDMAYENDPCSSSSDGSHLPATLTTSRQSAPVSLSQPSHVCATTSEGIVTE